MVHVTVFPGKNIGSSEEKENEMKKTAFLKGVIICSVHLLVLTNLSKG